MLVLFELSMPGNNSWNGKWSGDEHLYARVVNVGTSKKAREKYEKLIGHHGYSFGDGWRAMITIREVTSSAARKIRKDSSGFCGYDWMISSLRQWGGIFAAMDPIQEAKRTAMKRTLIDLRTAAYFAAEHQKVVDKLVALALDKLKECAKCCAECNGTGITVRWSGLIGDQRHEDDCDCCADLRETIAKCEES